MNVLRPDGRSRRAVGALDCPGRNPIRPGSRREGGEERLSAFPGVGPGGPAPEVEDGL